MKKIIVTAALLTSCTTALFAQKFMSLTSKVTFLSSTPLENFDAINNEVTSIIDAEKNGVAFIVPVKSFKFKSALMQEHFNENYMESDNFPKATFKGTFKGFDVANFSKEGTYKVTADGDLTIHGVTKTVSIPGTIQVKNGSIVSDAKFMVATKDYNIKVPSAVGTKIAQEIEVTVHADLKKK